MGKFVQLIYNPMAGARIFPSKIDYFIEVFQDKGYDVRIQRTKDASDFSTCLLEKDLTECEAIIVAGGDGSVNQIVNSMMKNDIDLPLGVIPAGTANDFANHLGIPFNFSECFELLAEMNIREIDVGKVNGEYFINVCCGGLFTNISQNIDIELKNTIGKLAYYIKGVQQLPKFTRIRFKIDTGDEIIDDYFFLFLLLNGSSAGGFNKLAKDAVLDDGYMDFIGIKECALNYLPTLFRKIITGEHLDDKNVVFCQIKKMNIECLEGLESFEESDIDGELGPKFPLRIDVLQKKLKVIGNCNVT
ncbi:MAG: diacylglycerol kinase [Firmicutes bacterium HGW-Firmicutes-1]|jgi:YegS/Rv2252/BmrU family lipid kinase|nr:MAG: diacylglycerol kinase [Firmicutes bacterium HGW-Firmicutes-1]